MEISTEEGVECRWKCFSRAVSHPGDVKWWRMRKLLMSCRVAGISMGDSVRRSRLWRLGLETVVVGEGFESPRMDS
jgi:hypothetical protein